MSMCRRRARGAMIVTCVTLLLLGLGTPAYAAGGGGGGGGAAGGAQSGGKKQRALAAYKKGENAKLRGVKALQAAAEIEDPEAKQEALDEADKYFRRALRDFKKATRTDRRFHQAYNEVGFAERMLGNYEAAIEAYDKALELEPGFPHAIEYRGEAYMRLGQLEEAKQAYMQLFANDRPLADMLMRKMTAWVKLQRRTQDGGPRDDLDAFATWIQERSEIAQQTAALTAGAEPHAW